MVELLVVTLVISLSQLLRSHEPLRQIESAEGERRRMGESDLAPGPVSQMPCRGG